jgi:hypothetical protein
MFDLITGKATRRRCGQEGGWRTTTSSRLFRPSVPITIRPHMLSPRELAREAPGAKNYPATAFCPTANVLPLRENPTQNESVRSCQTT